MGEIVIAAYRPKPGGAEKLLELTKDHVPFLRRLGLATDRPALMMAAKDGTILEVFEWRDGGIAAAHEHPEIHKLWEAYGAVCDYVKLSDVAETADLFAVFKPIEL